MTPEEIKAARLALLDWQDELENPHPVSDWSGCFGVYLKGALDALAATQAALAAMTTARDEACDYWESHLSGLEKRLHYGTDGGTRKERSQIAECRAVGKVSK